MHILRFGSLVLVVLLLLAPQGAEADTDFIRTVPGALVLAGRGEIAEPVQSVFLDLAGPPGARIVVVATEGKPRSVELWRKAGAMSVTHLGKKRLKPEELTRTLLEANAVWFEDGAAKLRKQPLLLPLLRNLLARGGVIGGDGDGTLALGVRGYDEAGTAVAAGLGLLPASAIQLIDGAAVKASGSRTSIVSSGDGFVGWQIPRGTAMVVHNGRRVATIGADRIVPRIAASGDWPEFRRMVPPMKAYEPGASLDHELDLLSWLRAARDRMGKPFPPKTLAAPTLKKGTLILSGGGGVSDETFARFIEAAGGKDARLVCIPSADGFAPGEAVRSYSARQLRKVGCTNVRVLHTTDPGQADADPRFLAELQAAKGIWIDGGRTYRLADVFQGTKAQRIMQTLLDRGGVIGGSSAGCQIAGAFLLRGDPRSNSRLVYEGYTRGLDFLPGVVLDAHFRQRKRQHGLKELIQEMPQLLGIGVDANAAVMIEGHIATVLGKEAVTFYAAKDGQVDGTLVESGGRYDLKAREKAP